MPMTPVPMLARSHVVAQARKPLVTRFGWLRAGLGAVQALFPGLASRLLVIPPLDRRSRGVIRVLGIRQVGQALVTGPQPSAAVLLLGAEVDAAHAASMVTLALCSRRWRRAALADAMIATLFALAGAAAARSGGRPAPQTQWSARGDRLAERVATRLVPDRLLRGARPDESQGDPHA
jgi:hypothetical protein